MSTSTDLNVVEDERQPRRKKLKGLGGEILIPTPEANDNLKEKLKLKFNKENLQLECS